MPFDFSREYQKQVTRILNQGFAAPNALNTFVGLIAPTTAPSIAATIQDIVALEVIPDSPNNGYLRQVMGQQITALDAATDTFTCAEHRRAVNQEIFLFSNAYPVPFAALTPYYINNPTTNTFRLSASPGGSQIDLTTGSLGAPLYMKMGSTFNATNKREESTYDEVRFTALGNTITFQGFFILDYADSLSSVQLSSINTSTDVITTAAAHGRTTGDPVIVNTITGAMPGGVTPNALYYARSLTTTTLTLHTTAANASANTGRIDITSAGSGTIFLRNCRGTLRGWDWYDTPIVIPVDRTQIIEIPTLISNQRNAVGVP